MLDVRPESLRSLFITAHCRGGELGSATAFLVRHMGLAYLITNYHVAAGRDPRTLKPRHDSAGDTDLLRAYRPVVGGPVRRWVSQDVPTRRRAAEPNQSDDNQPLWLEHPDHGPRVDVVAIPIGPAVAPPEGVH